MCLAVMAKMVSEIKARDTQGSAYSLVLAHGVEEGCQVHLGSWPDAVPLQTVASSIMWMCMYVCKNG